MEVIALLLSTIVSPPFDPNTEYRVNVCDAGAVREVNLLTADARL